jgi:hypothetical protein
MVPAALFSAVVIALTVGVSAAQAALVRGRGAPAGRLPTGHGGTSVGLVITAVAIVAVIAAGIVYAIVADRRQLTPAGAAGEPTRLAENKREAEQERKAA